MTIQRLTFCRILNGPFLVPRKGTAAPDAVTTPDVLFFNNILHLYIGSVDGDREQIIHQDFPVDSLGEDVTPREISTTSGVVLQAGPYDFNCKHVFDPATIYWNDKVHLFFSAIGEGDDSIGLAISNDGIKFDIVSSPVAVGRSPEVILHNGKLYLFFVKHQTNMGYRIYSATFHESNGVEHTRSAPVLSVGPSGEWDHFEVTTPRLFERNGIFYMIYAGSQNSDREDVPDAFGLARSENLLDWEKYPHNPVFRKGNQGSWDDGAIWFGTVFKYGNFLYLLYEGGRSINITNKSPQLTEVGIAKLKIEEFDRIVSTW